MVSLRFTSMKDFSPERVASQIPVINKLVEPRMACRMLRDLLDRIPAFRERLELLLKELLEALEDAPDMTRSGLCRQVCTDDCI